MSPSDLRDHPLRHVLTEELHARPFARLVAPQRATHLALLSGEGTATDDRAHVAALCARFGAPPPAADSTHHMVVIGPLTLKWERHTEFSSYTFFWQPADDDVAAAAPLGEVFSRTALDFVPRDWLETLPGELLVGVHLAILSRDTPAPDPDDVARLFGTDNLAGSLVSSEAAAIFLDFRIHDDGFERILIHDRGMRPRQAGRLVQRLFEIATYRTTALLALPVARRYGLELSEAGKRLTEMTSQLAHIAGLEDERRLLASLTGLWAQVERVAAEASYRFGAARAYYALVQRRVEELREQRIAGLQTVREFLDRRLAPAMRTCQATAERLDTLSQRIARASDLLRTRVDIQLEAQNSDLLRSMNRRVELQLRLQQTVEGLSVAAISYYLVGLIYYAAKGAKTAGLPLAPDFVAGAAIPIVVTAVAVGLWRFRRRLHRLHRQAREEEH